MEKNELTEMPQINVESLKDSLKTVGDTEFANNLTESINTISRKKAKRKFCFTQPTKIQIPSGGRFYQDSDDEELKKGIVSLLPMSMGEEEILTNKKNLEEGVTFEKLFETTIQTNYPAKEILYYDAVYLMYALRQISYGNDYNFELTCGSCGNKFNYTLDISEIDFEELKQENDKREIKLPVSKYTICMRLKRLKDEAAIKSLLNKDISSRIADFYVRTEYIKDEKGNDIEKEDWIDFFECLPTLDKEEIKKSFIGSENEPKITVKCSCGNKMVIDVPIDEDFFRI